MRITGTFLDEIGHDIPAQNWGRAEFLRKSGLGEKLLHALEQLLGRRVRGTLGGSE